MPSLRRQFLLDPKVTFLNHGSFGATPKPVFRAYQCWHRELERQPVEFLGRRHNELMRTARGALATYLGTSAENVVYTQNDTIALNIVARSLELEPGDEVLPANTDILALKTRLYDEYGIEVPFIAWKDHKLIRVSIQAYNSRRDVDRLLRALKACLL